METSLQRQQDYLLRSVQPTQLQPFWVSRHDEGWDGFYLEGREGCDEKCRFFKPKGVWSSHFHLLRLLSRSGSAAAPLGLCIDLGVQCGFVLDEHVSAL